MPETPTPTPFPEPTEAPTATPGDLQASLNEEFELNVGESAYIPGADFTLRFVGVAQDSRCPADVECVQAGDATILVDISQDGRLITSEVLSLASNEIPMVEGYGVRFVSLAPAPVSTQTIQESGYTATLVVSADTTSLGAAYSDFGFDLFAELAEADSGENVFISPLSVAIALAMTYNGASGETREDMAEVLKLAGMDIDEVTAANEAFLVSLDNLDPRVELAIANSLWSREGFDFKQDFLERNRESFDAEITSLDFNDPGAKDTINAWVDENTRGKIDSIIDRIDPMDVMFLINAIYFNGKWTVEFKEEHTTDMPFHLPNGTEKQHPMMFQAGKYQYLQGDDFQAVALPYGDNKRVSMYIFLPSGESSLDEFLNGLDSESWDGWMSQFAQKEGDVRIPRFRTEYESELNDALTALGMGVAFSEQNADFSEMTDAQVFISEVKHKAVVEVNEEGTEAAAVTSVGVTVTSAVIEPERFSFTADRPFFYAIRDDQTGSVIFMGTLVTPEE
jgi:serpin B